MKVDFRLETLGNIGLLVMAVYCLPAVLVQNSINQSGTCSFPLLLKKPVKCRDVDVTGDEVPDLLKRKRNAGL